MMKGLAVFLLLQSIVGFGGCSWFDPHEFPASGPFFEGWYVRITDFTRADSVGLLFGSVLPASGEKVSGPLVLASILRRDCGSDNACTLVSTDGAFNLSDLEITAHGQNPNVKSPANFTWQVSAMDNGGYLKQNGNITEANFRLGDISLVLKASDPFPWSSDGYGPEGFLGLLPLPLHWFVFSLRSRLDYYEIQNVTSGKVVRGTTGVVHLEKNWGKSFPRKWVWSEGVKNDASNASFALSGGVVDFSIVPVTAYLVGYRNPSKGLAIDFRPPSLVTASVDGCAGSVNITANGLFYKVAITLTAKTSSFSTCLYGPKTHGFQRACVESFDGTANIEISKRSFFGLSFISVDRQVFDNIGLEFGGSYVCHDACSKP